MIKREPRVGDLFGLLKAPDKLCYHYDNNKRLILSCGEEAFRAYMRLFSYLSEEDINQKVLNKYKNQNHTYYFVMLVNSEICTLSMPSDMWHNYSQLFEELK